MTTAAWPVRGLRALAIVGRRQESAMQKWQIWVDGRLASTIRADRKHGAQYVLNKAKTVYPGSRIEVVAAFD